MIDARRANKLTAAVVATTTTAVITTTAGATAATCAKTYTHGTWKVPTCVSIKLG